MKITQKFPIAFKRKGVTRIHLSERVYLKIQIINGDRVVSINKPGTGYTASQRFKRGDTVVNLQSALI